MKLKNTLLLLTAFSYANVFAQPKIARQEAFGGNDWEHFARMIYTKDGGDVLAGSSSSDISGDKTENPKGGSDYWIVKRDKNKVIQWDKTFGGTDTDVLTCIQQTNDAGYILGGYSFSGAGADKAGFNRGDVDYWVVKLDSLGNIQWERTIGGDDYDYPYAVYQTRDGGYLLGGYSYSNVSFDKTAVSRGRIDYWLVKLNGSGNIQWDKAIGGNKEDQLSSMTPTKDNGFILGGYSLSLISGEKTERRRGPFADYWLVKLDSLYNIEWDKTIGGSGSDDLKVVRQTSDGGYILGGNSYSEASNQKSDSSRGDADFWIVKLDSSRKIEWDKTLGGSGLDQLYDIIETMDKGFLAGGYSRSFISGEKTEDNRGPSYYGDYWATKLTKNGSLQWDKTIGSWSEDWILEVKEIARNNYLLCGFSWGTNDGDKKVPSKGQADFWIVGLKYTKPAEAIQALSKEMSISKFHDQKVREQFIVYPNPAKEILHIQNTGKATFILTDQSGKTVLTKIINDKDAINVSHLPAGLYYLKNNETGAVQKVVITK